MKLIIVLSEIPKNPYTKGSASHVIFSYGQQSILSLPSISVEDILDIIRDLPEPKDFIGSLRDWRRVYTTECLKAKEAGLK